MNSFPHQNERRQVTSPKAGHSLAPLKPGWLGQVACALCVLAGVSGILSAFLQMEQGFTGTFWFRLLTGLGFLSSGILQFVARRKQHQILKAAGGGAGS